MSLEWPALQDFIIPETLVIEYEQGVWGKAHGARTDYRWLALTAKADFKETGLGKDLSLGDEEAPRISFFWRYLNGHHYAVMAYPSQAEDATNRSGFLEKQILRLKSSQNIPAALAAILLFSELYNYDDAVWWNRRKEVDWDANPHAYLTLSPCEQKVFNELEIEQFLDKAITDLQSYFRNKKDNLAQLYAHLRASSTFQLESSTPLSHLALASLLLPLPRERADTLSLAGWYPSATVSQEMAAKWNVLVLPSDLFAKLDTQEPKNKALTKLEHSQDVENFVEAIFSNNPNVLKSEEEKQFPQLPKPYCNMACIKELRDFAMRFDRRWLDANNWQFQEDARLPTENDEKIGKKLLQWVKSLEEIGKTPRYTDENLEAAFKAQWAVKIILLKIAVFILYPSQFLKNKLAITISMDPEFEIRINNSVNNYAKHLLANNYPNFIELIKEHNLYDEPKVNDE